MMDSAEPELAPLTFSITAAAKAMSVSTTAVRQFIAERELVTVTLGDRELIRADVLYAFLDRRSAAAARREAAKAPPPEAIAKDHHAQAAPVSEPPLAYSVADAAVAIGVSKATIWRLLSAGELHSFKLGARTLIKAGTLRGYVDRISAAKPPE